MRLTKPIQTQPNLPSKITFEFLWRMPIIIFPLLFFWPVLFLGQNNVLSLPGLNGLTDTLGLVRVAQMAPTMANPLGEQFFTNYPMGEVLWNLSSLTQSIQFVFLWVMGNFLDPFFSANLFLLIGWVFTGLAVFELSKSIGLPDSYALAAGISAQFLPGIQIANATVPSMLFTGFPILTLALMIQWSQTKKNSYLYFSTLIIVIALFFDGYVYYFTLLIFWLTILLNPKVNTIRLWNLKFRWMTFILIIGISSVPIVAKVINLLGLDGEGTNRTLVSPTFGMMQVNGFSLSQLIAPHPESIYGKFLISQNELESLSRLSFSFLGFCITIFALFFVVRALVEKSRPYLTVVAAFLLLLLLSLKGYYSFFDFVFPNPAGILLSFFPGLIYVDRTSFIVQNLLVVMCFSGIYLLVNRHFLSRLTFRKAKIHNFWIPFLASFIIFIEMMPFSSRYLPDESIGYKEIKSVVNGEPIVFFPENYFGRSWIQQVFIDAPMANSLQHPLRVKSFIDKNFPGAPSQVACDLAKSGIKYVVLETDYLQKDPEVRSRLTLPYFSVISQSVVPAFEDGTTKISLLRVHSNCQLK